MSLVSELRRRQVFRAVAWYGGLSWLAVEVANTVFPQFDLPDWSVRAVIVTALVGLPVVVALAWFFDLGRGGLTQETVAAASTSAVPAVPLWRIPSFWVALALGAGLAVSIQEVWQRLVLPDYGDRPGIAVLPFANLSPDPENAYFADGLHEEILATFARTGSLRVISRRSVQEYRDAKRNLREIADALDVDLILEGSVRRDGDDLRLTLQLIDGRTDEHLWAETYDRRFREALQLQRTVAEQVVAAVGSRLTPAEQQLLVQATPTKPEAYEHYLHALALNRANWSEPAELDLAVSLLTDAIAIDPGFALAYAARAHAGLWRIDGGRGTEEQRKAIQADIERALDLQSGLPDALAARGLYATYIDLDPERALADLERVLELTPSDAYAQSAAALTLRRLGRLDAALERFEQAAELSPNQFEPRMEHAATLVRIGRHHEAGLVLTALADRFPARAEARLMRGFNEFLATGETRAWQADFARFAPLLGGFARSATWELALRTSVADLPGQIDLLERMHQQQVENAYGESVVLQLAIAHLLAGQPERARPLLQSMIAEAEAQPGAETVAGTAIALELLGRSEDAVRAADEAVRLRPEQRDALNGASNAMVRAWVLIHSGIRAEEGYAELERLLGHIDLQPRWVAATLHWRLLGEDSRAQQIIRSRFPGA